MFSFEQLGTEVNLTAVNTVCYESKQNLVFIRIDVNPVTIRNHVNILNGVDLCAIKESPDLNTKDTHSWTASDKEANTYAMHCRCKENVQKS